MRWTRERGALVPVVEDVLADRALMRWEAFDLSKERDRQRLDWRQQMRQAVQESDFIAAVPGNAYVVNSAAFVLSTSAKTAINIIAGTSNAPAFVEFGVSSNGTTGDLLIELVFSTQGAVGTVGSSPTPSQIRQAGPLSPSAATAGISYTAEPTTLTRMKAWRMAAPGGPFVFQSPLGRETGGLITAATAGKGIGLRLTASTGTPTSDSYVEYEE